uniref:PIN domain-containing protein n=1 Tax=Candidatus Kentrum sp. SD TaxID=2126332 RepID=A0A450Y492_9GAMM|nr:MAG: PIN domain-containing protein [Candidatus Kentron sp. SD]VFK38535.1 MAG: PIN domain-containing protein [Candidatus Kentron sp. SD]
MKRTVYIETSVISYLTARPSKTILGAAHQQLTKLWWDQRISYDLFVSQVVWRECAAGDPDAATKRLRAIEGLDVLAISEETIELAEDLVTQRLIPTKALEDALHICVATMHRADFLLTWNCRHIANPLIQEGIAEYLEPKGLFLPIICTPEELLGDRYDERRDYDRSAWH